METIKEILMRRDGITSDQADQQIATAKKDLVRLLNQGRTDKAFYICEKHFGLEPDYLDQLIS